MKNRNVAMQSFDRRVIFVLIQSMIPETLGKRLDVVISTCQYK